MADKGTRPRYGGMAQAATPMARRPTPGTPAIRIQPRAHTDWHSAAIRLLKPIPSPVIIPHHVRAKAHSASPMALLPISKDSKVLCQRDPVPAAAAGGAVTTGNLAGVTALLALDVAGTFIT